MGHNTACRYNFDLAFFGLSDSRELRLAYWAALNEVKFDEKDRVIIPVDDSKYCPACGEE